MSKKLFKVKKIITTCFNKTDDNYCWYNIKDTLSDEDIDELREYFNKNEKMNFMLIINGCNELRPQRTCMTFPNWLKDTNGYRGIYKTGYNSFILCSWMKSYDDGELGSYGEDINELLSTIPNDMDTCIFNGWED